MTAPGPDAHPDFPGRSDGPTTDDPLDVAASARVDASDRDAAEMADEASQTDDALRAIAERAAQFQALGDIVRTELPAPISDEAWLVRGLDRTQTVDQSEPLDTVARDAAIRAALVAGGFAAPATSLDAHRSARSDHGTRATSGGRVVQTSAARRSRRIVQLGAAAAIITVGLLLIPRLAQRTEMNVTASDAAQASAESSQNESGDLAGAPKSAPQSEVGQATDSASSADTKTAADNPAEQDRSMPSTTSQAGQVLSSIATTTIAAGPAEVSRNDAPDQVDESGSYGEADPSMQVEQSAFVVRLLERVACVAGLATDTPCA